MAARSTQRRQTPYSNSENKLSLILGKALETTPNHLQIVAWKYTKQKGEEGIFMTFYFRRISEKLYKSGV